MSSIENTCFTKNFNQLTTVHHSTLLQNDRRLLVGSNRVHVIPRVAVNAFQSQDIADYFNILIMDSLKRIKLLT